MSDYICPFRTNIIRQDDGHIKKDAERILEVL